MASAPRKRKRITPTLVALDAAENAEAKGALDAPLATAAPVVVEELEVVAKAVKQLQPLKVGRIKIWGNTKTPKHPTFYRKHHEKKEFVGGLSGVFFFLGCPKAQIWAAMGKDVPDNAHMEADQHVVLLIGETQNYHLGMVYSTGRPW